MIKKTKYLKPLNNNDIIWRYMNLSKFMDLALNKTLWFSRQDKLKDQFEGEMPIENQIELFNQLKKSNPSNSSFQNFQKSYDEVEKLAELRKFTLVNSWTHKEYESMALWKIYLDNNSNGIAIQSTVGNYKESLKNNDFPIKPVKIDYIDEFEKLPTLNQEIVAGTKMNFYDYEDEFRGVIFGQFKENGRSKKPKYDFGVNVPVDCNILISKIVTSPMASEWFINIIRKVKKDYLDSKEKQIDIYTSSLKEVI